MVANIKDKSIFLFTIHEWCEIKNGNLEDEIGKTTKTTQQGIECILKSLV